MITEASGPRDDHGATRQRAAVPRPHHDHPARRVIRAHTAAQVRAAEAALMAVLPPGTLMQRAAEGLAVACAARLPRVYGSRVVLLVGAGDNGADALWAGARLARRGAQVVAVLVGEPRDDALAALHAAGGRTGTAADVDGADLVVDGLVGIGGRGALREPAAALAERARGRDVVAVDLPSGVDADTGAVEGRAVQASLTVTFGTHKPGLLVGAGPAARRRGPAGRHRARPVAAGARRSRRSRTSTSPHCCPPRAGSDKYTRGVVGVVAGSPQYTGAAVLAVGAAVRPGPGWSGSPGRSTPPSRSAAAGRRRWCTRVAAPTSSTPAACRPGWWARGSAPTTSPRPPSRPCSRRTSRCWSTPTA
jgi:hydroxyethylthiazole kinase-like uncharacterized protein yjeF